MKRAFVMGVTGYIGGSVARRLLQEGYRVTGLVRTLEASERASNPSWGGLRMGPC
ncbi:NAD-dependent epimerase/dehydratase family protein [Cystobacter ferrugineus]|uniref:NAD-dependent epimerase/dehydratase family protein n=1 Tax=Cystobacter ferrugineus TaxID=83449 RepID=UPI000B29548E|nr:NAD-dependent epimerase/dehydratase family protein [Cystobacter ferrugineus]